MGLLNPSFKMQSQEQSNWCWAAVSTAIRKYLPPQTATTQCAVANEVLKRTDCCSNGSGCNQTQTVEDALGTRLHQEFDDTVNFEVIQDQIDRGRPICVRIAWDTNHDGFEDGAHVVAISGWSIVGGVPCVVITDPDGGANQETGGQANIRILPLETFATAYLGSGVWVKTYLVKGA